MIDHAKRIANLNAENAHIEKMDKSLVAVYVSGWIVVIAYIIGYLRG